MNNQRGSVNMMVQLLILICFIAACAAIHFAGKDNKGSEDLNRLYTDLNSRHNDTKSKLNKTIDEHKADVEELDHQISDVKKELEEKLNRNREVTKQTTTQLQEMISKVNQENIFLNKKIERILSHVSKRITKAETSFLKSKYKSRSWIHYVKDKDGKKHKVQDTIYKPVLPRKKFNMPEVPAGKRKAILEAKNIIRENEL